MFEEVDAEQGWPVEFRLWVFFSPIDCGWSWYSTIAVSISLTSLHDAADVGVASCARGSYMVY